MPAPHSYEICTIAIGDVYQQIAKITVPRMERLIGAPVRILSEPHPNPLMFKLDLLKHTDAEHLLFIDVDIVLHAWDWAPFEPEKFNAVVCYSSLFPDILQSLRQHIPAPAPLFNSGFWLAPKSVQPVFQLAKDIAENELNTFKFQFNEETPLNLALHRTGFPCNELPEKYNNLQHIWKIVQPVAATDTIGMHLLSGNPLKKLARIKRYCERYPL